MFRKFVVFLAASSFSVLLFISATTTSVLLTFRPNNLKQMLNTSKVYDNVVQGVLDESKSLIKEGANPGEKNPLQDPGVQAAAKKTLTPEFIKTTTEKIIDGTSPWLEGKLAKPSFNIDLATVKNSFAENIAVYARDRFANLPLCPPNAIPDTSDILAVPCKPKNFNPEPEIQKAVNELKNNKDFLPNSVLSPDTITVGNGADKKPFYQHFEKAPKVYQASKQAPLILGALTLLSGLIVIFVSEDRRRGLRKVMVTLYVAGAVLIAEVLMVNFLFKKGEEKLIQSNTTGGGFDSIRLNLPNVLKNNINGVLLYFAGGFVVLAALITLYLFLTRPKISKALKNKAPEFPAGTPSESLETTPKLETTEKPESAEKPKIKEVSKE